MRELSIPELSLVVLVGVSGSGKSTFARRAFAPHEVLSSDACRALVSGDENDQAATKDAFDVLHYIAAKRLAAGRLTVVDATNVQRDARAQLVSLARAHDVLPAAIVLDVGERVAQARHAARTDRPFGPDVIRRQSGQLRRSIAGLRKEGFRDVHVLTDDVDDAVILRRRLLTDMRDHTGPFDVIGDVHGCRAELDELLRALGYVVQGDGARHPQGRTAVFVGDLVDRGPDSPGVLRLVMRMVADGQALCVAGNHEDRLARALRGKDVKRTHGLAETLAQLAEQQAAFVEQAGAFCNALISHLVLDGGRLVVAHAGLKLEYHNRASGRVRAFALYGDTTGEIDEFGLPVRLPWAREYRGDAMVLYGHTPAHDHPWVNNTMCLDTGCVFGGRLSALRYPERELVSVPAHRVWYEPVKPLGPPPREADVLAITDVTGKRAVETADGRITVREDQAAAALEVMSRFAVDASLIRYLPPTMSPCEASSLPEFLEHPDEAFALYRKAGVATVMCQEKHMGSRAVVLLRRDASGTIHTRTGRPMFSFDVTQALLARLRDAADGLWDELGTDWLLLDAEVLPWSAKALDLLRTQYAAVGAAARTSLTAAVTLAEQAGIDAGPWMHRLGNAEAFTRAYRRYCWPTDGIQGVSVAPFMILASEGRSHIDADHGWHLAHIDRMVAADPEVLRPTRRLIVATGEPQPGVQWWLDLTGAGGEGMVVKPLQPAPGVQPGIKVRGREYLRIIYGPDYLDHLTRLKDRRLGLKRSLALREHALGREALRRQAAGQPLWRVHEAVFAVLALESEPVDPRL